MIFRNVTNNENAPTRIAKRIYASVNGDVDKAVDIPGHIWDYWGDRNSLTGKNDGMTNRQVAKWQISLLRGSIPEGFESVDKFVEYIDNCINKRKRR